MRSSSFLSVSCTGSTPLVTSPHQFWQSVHPAGTYSSDPGAGFIDSYPAGLPDGRQILLPVRVLPGDGNEAVCS
jgi:hypothetical protein